MSSSFSDRLIGISGIVLQQIQLSDHTYSRHQSTEIILLSISVIFGVGAYQMLRIEMERISVSTDDVMIPILTTVILLRVCINTSRCWGSLTSVFDAQISFEKFKYNFSTEMNHYVFAKKPKCTCFVFLWYIWFSKNIVYSMICQKWWTGQYTNQSVGEITSTHLKSRGLASVQALQKTKLMSLNHRNHNHPNGR